MIKGYYRRKSLSPFRFYKVYTRSIISFGTPGPDLPSLMYSATCHLTVSPAAFFAASQLAISTIQPFTAMLFQLPTLYSFLKSTNFLRALYNLGITGAGGRSTGASACAEVAHAIPEPQSNHEEQNEPIIYSQLIRIFVNKQRKQVLLGFRFS